MRRLLLLLVLGLVAQTCSVLAQSDARLAGYLYLSPMPSASYVAPQNCYILVRFTQASPSSISNLLSGFISVAGQITGPHRGTAKLASDGKTVIYQIAADFDRNELVTVSLNPATDPAGPSAVTPFQYQFMTGGPFPGSEPFAVLPPAVPVVPPVETNPPASNKSSAMVSSTKSGQARRVMRFANGVSVPSDFPQVSITVNTNPSPGYLFLENGLNGVPPYTMMLDNHGLPVWYRRGRMYDFKIQPNGLITWCLSDDTGFPAFDQNFNYVKTYLTANGYLTDGHELKVLPDGRYFLIGYRTNTVDMSRYVYGDNTIAIARETVVQEFTAADELILQWRAWDNFNLGDQGGNSDFPHMNGLDIDDDGNLLVSSRHLSEITKVDLDSGDVIWRLSGPHSDFVFVNDPYHGTSFQHNISALGNGHYMVFDNGDTRSPPFSRAVEYALDLTNKTATLVWQFRDRPDKYAFWMGNAQRLPSGNTLIDFVAAQYPKAIEVDNKGVKHFELSLDPGSDSYRAFRFPWNGVVAAPYLVTEVAGDTVTLVYNKFGDHSVASYRIYGGSVTNPTALLAQSTSTFQTISNLQNGLHYFRVTAVGTDGKESPFSNQEAVRVDVGRPGENIVVNGDFGQQSSNWSFNVNNTAAAAWTILNGYSHFNISSPGTSLTAVELVQGGLSLSVGSTYVLEFDAWASGSRYIEAKVLQTTSPFADYGRIPPSYITPNLSHFSYAFTMKNASDPAAQLVFEMGAVGGDVYLSHISLFSPAPGDFNLDGRVNLLDLDVLCGSWLKQQTNSPADLDGNGLVDFRDFTVFGNYWGGGSP